LSCDRRSSFEQRNIVAKENDFNFFISIRVVRNLLRAAYLENIVSVATRTRAEIIRSDPICPNVVNPAYFKEEILIGFTNFPTSNPKVLFNRYTSVHADIQSASEEFFSSGFAECFAKICLLQATLEVLISLEDLTF